MVRHFVSSLLLLSIPVAALAQDHVLLATPSTVAVGYYSSFSKPALTIRSGETVKMQSLASCSANDGIPPDQIPKYVASIREQVTDKGPGGHVLTGPVFVEGAEVGDMLEVEVVKIDLDVPYACNHFRATAGFLQSEFLYAKAKVIPLDREKMVAHFAPGLDIPLHPSSAAWALRRHRRESQAFRPTATEEIWITRNSPSIHISSIPYGPKVLCLKSAMVTLDKGTEKSM